MSAASRRQINIACIIDDAHPFEACVGDWVLVHVGFAMSRIDEAEAAETLKHPGRARRSAGRDRGDDAAARARRRNSMSNESVLQSLYPFLHGERAGRGASSTPRSSHSVAEKARRLARRQRPLFRRARPQRWSRRRGRSPRSIAAAAGCSRWAMAGRAATPRTSRSSSLHPVTAGRPALAGDQPRRRCRDDLGGRQRCRLRARLRPPDHRAGHGRATRLIGVSTSGNSAEPARRLRQGEGDRPRRRSAFAGGDGGRMTARRRGRSLPRRAVELDPPHPGMPRRRLSHPVGPRACAARRCRGSAVVKELAA